MSERYTTARKAAARPHGAPSVMSGTYTGAELTTRSSRPGAYDAMAIPSLISGRRIDHSTREPVEHQAAASVAVPIDADTRSSTVQRIKEAITADYDELSQMSPAMKAQPEGAMRFIQCAGGSTDFLGPDVGDRRFFVLGPVDPPDADQLLDVSPDEAKALHTLWLRLEQLEALERHVRLLQARARLFRVAASLPFPPLPEPPRLTDAA